MSAIKSELGAALAREFEQMPEKATGNTGVLVKEINTKIQYYGSVAPGTMPSRPHVALALAASSAVRALINDPTLLRQFDDVVSRALEAITNQSKPNPLGKKITDSVFGL